MDNQTITLINNKTNENLKEAYNEHGKYNSLHEALAVIREEYIELEQEIFKKPNKRCKERVLSEVVDLMVACKHFMYDLIDDNLDVNR